MKWFNSAYYKPTYGQGVRWWVKGKGIQESTYLVKICDESGNDNAPFWQYLDETNKPSIREYPYYDMPSDEEYAYITPCIDCQSQEPVYPKDAFTFRCSLCIGTPHTQKNCPLKRPHNFDECIDDIRNTR